MERLPLDCEAYYIRDFIPAATRSALYDKFLNSFDWEIRETDYGKGGATYKLNRATCAFGDPGVEAPVVWGSGLVVAPWTAEMTKIKDDIELITGKRFNICLCNFYATGKRGIGFHADNEERGSTSCIASVSLGAERTFVFSRNSDSATHSMRLADGSLLVMGENCQENYRHSVPADKEVETGRINLTFRWFDKKRYFDDMDAIAKIN